MELTSDPTCVAAYGHNPDRCYQPAGHAGTHSNRWGTTWAPTEPTPTPRRNPPSDTTEETPNE